MMEAHTLPDSRILLILPDGDVSPVKWVDNFLAMVNGPTGAAPITIGGRLLPVKTYFEEAPLDGENQDLLDLGCRYLARSEPVIEDPRAAVVRLRVGRVYLRLLRPRRHREQAFTGT